MKKVISFGELILRISLDQGKSWLKNKQFPFFLGGAELNVIRALALWGTPTGYVTALPNNNFANQIIGSIKAEGIDVSAIQRLGNKVSLYYLVSGEDLKSAEVIYDRQNSSFSELRTGRINWDKVFQGVSIFHFSAISPAISLELAKICEEALMEAKKRDIMVSVDLNYRRQLWKYVISPIEVMSTLMKYCSTAMGNIWAMEDMLGIPIDYQELNREDKVSCWQMASKSSEELIRRFPNCKTVANTFRFKREDGIHYHSCLYTNDELYGSKEYFSKKVIDMAGSGDCYMAGLLYGIYNDMPWQQTVNFATKAAFSKLFVSADATNLNKKEIEEFVKNYEKEEV